MVRVLLFDIDLTLINTGGAGSRAMTLTFEELYGVADAFRSVPFAGRTDHAILRDALRLHGLEDGDVRGQVARFHERYLRRLADLLPETPGRVLPGVVDLLEALRRRPGVTLGLATGNFRASAQLKLAHYGLWHHFVGGGFGDDTEHRAEVVAAAVRDVAPHLTGDGALQVTVIGDSPLDVEAARANGFTAVGVATGLASREELQGAGAHLVFADLSDLAPVEGALLA